MQRGRFLYPVLAASAMVAGLAWFSGSVSIDFMDGTEFVICGRSLQLPHPPGYPLYIFFLRLFSLLTPCARLDYACFRLFSSMVAGGTVAAAYAAARRFSCSRAGSLAGAVMLISSGPVLAQLNVVEVHGFAILLVLLAISLGRSPSGPYFFSLSLFAGHPTSIFLLPPALSGRFRERWLLPAALPVSLWLFAPLRSTFGGLCHYSSPADADALWRYLTLYGSRLALPSLNGLQELVRATGIMTLAAMAGLAAFSGRWSWRLFLSFLGGILFVSSYTIPDTSSILWIAVLPLGLWASMGLSRMFGGGRLLKAAAVALVFLSVLSGASMAWRRNDRVTDVIAGDYMRGAGPGAVLVTAGMSTFHSAYLMEVADRRPDIIPMDTHRCFFRMAPPEELPEFMGGRAVYAIRGWENDNLHLNGLLFTSGTRPVDWSDYDIFTYSGEVHDTFAGDEVAEIWARRGVQTLDEGERERCMETAVEWARGRVAVERIRMLREGY
ncbi:MAG: DUF2723 domain-containing protein [Candidatus Fermentibacteraceae bacterium]|nr:DUF2723 domain-containing protein [Candidatus Fermentibacteraceae bacterium]